MCGRFAQIRHSEKYAKRFGLLASDNLDLEPSFNTDIGGKAVLAGSDLELKPAVFGFSPSWSTKQLYLFNARAEGDLNATNDPGFKGPFGIFEKPSFRQAILNQRVVVPVDYFVEGPEKEKLKKPFLVHRKDGEPFLLAGIQSIWVHPVSGDKINTFSILTTTSNKLMGLVGHHRSPMVLTDESARTWLNRQSGKDTLSQLMIPFDDSDFEAFPVDPQIGKRNTPAHPNNSPELMKPIGPSITRQ